MELERKADSRRREMRLSYKHCGMLVAAHIIIKCANLRPTEGDNDTLAENDTRQKARLTNRRTRKAQPEVAQ